MKNMNIMRSNLEFLNSELRPNMCKFRIANLKDIKIVSNYKFETKHIDYL